MIDYLNSYFVRQFIAKPTEKVDQAQGGEEKRHKTPKFQTNDRNLKLKNSVVR